MTRVQWLVIFGGTILIAAYFALTPAFEFFSRPGIDPIGERQTIVLHPEQRAGEFAPVFQCDYSPSALGKPRKYYRSSFWPRDEVKVAEIEIRRGQVFWDEKLVSREAITSELNDRVAKDKLEAVILFGEEGFKMGELIPILDQCRKSKVQGVYVSSVALR